MPWGDKVMLITEWASASVRKALGEGACSCVSLFVTPWTAAYQAPLSMGFSRQEHWSGLPCPPLGGLPDLELEPTSLTSSARAGRFYTTSATWEAQESPVIDKKNVFNERKPVNIALF